MRIRGSCLKLHRRPCHIQNSNPNVKVRTSHVFQKDPGELRCAREPLSFFDCIDLFIGLDEETEMKKISIHHDLLCDWADKPWHLRPSKSDADPPSSKAVLISRRLKPSQPSIFQTRLTDDHDNIPRRVAAASTEPPAAQQGQARFFPPPAFVHDIFGLLALPHDFLLENSIFIRTWYVHHLHYPRWAVPRLFELDHIDG